MDDFQQDERMLLQAALAGDAEAMTALLSRNEKRIYNICFRMVSHRDDAAELTQDTLAKTVERLQEFRGDAKLSTWMTRIAMNLCISHLRKRKHRQHLSLSDDPRAGSGSGSDQFGNQPRAGLGASLADQQMTTPAQQAEQHEDLALLEQALASLDDELRQIIVLRDIDEMDYQQISDVLDLKIGTVKSKLFRARLALREKCRNLGLHHASKTQQAAGGESVAFIKPDTQLDTKPHVKPPPLPWAKSSSDNQSDPTSDDASAHRRR